MSLVPEVPAAAISMSARCSGQVWVQLGWPNGDSPWCLSVGALQRQDPCTQANAIHTQMFSKMHVQVPSDQAISLRAPRTGMPVPAAEGSEAARAGAHGHGLPVPWQFAFRAHTQLATYARHSTGSDTIVFMRTLLSAENRLLTRALPRPGLRIGLFNFSSSIFCGARHGTLCC